MTVETLIGTKGTYATIHIEADTTPCPCLTQEGYRDPEWHINNPTAPECNDAGYLFNSNETIVKAFILPAGSGGWNRANLSQLFGEIQTDDHLGIFLPTAYDFTTWSPAGENYIVAGGVHYTVVGHNLFPDPDNTLVMHHWEVALRKISIDTQAPTGTVKQITGQIGAGTVAT